MGKSILSARIDEEIFKRFQAICKADRRSQATMLEIMIENYNPINPVKFPDPIKPQPASSFSESVNPVIKKPILPAKKEEPKRLSLAEEMERLRNEK